eukprot:NODE_3605_length_872_cov_52.159732_g3583_i0.p1 GENE.NODE_3605_length_872_cov_52.159732_g3583_i0~~NODE_3605_length_872_cov_52.159732_g3583_i0.p1  ORF type:complete len:238 (-),score=38.25 NODE_3605_length_872_cov_52.159732_g3583_i0:30-743(-)
MASTASSVRTRKKRKQDEAAPKLHKLTGSKVWVKVHGAPWWPAQVLQAEELKMVPSAVTAEFYQSNADTLVRFFGSGEFYYCKADNSEVILPWEWRVCIPTANLGLAAAIAAAEKGEQEVELQQDPSGVGGVLMPPNKKSRRCCDVLPGGFDGEPAYNTLEEEEKILLDAKNDLERRLAELQTTLNPMGSAQDIAAMQTQLQTAVLAQAQALQAGQPRQDKPTPAADPPQKDEPVAT